MVPRNNSILFTARKLKETNKHENRKSTRDLFRKLHDFNKELASINSPYKLSFEAYVPSNHFKGLSLSKQRIQVARSKMKISNISLVPKFYIYIHLTKYSINQLVKTSNLKPFYLFPNIENSCCNP